LLTPRPAIEQASNSSFISAVEVLLIEVPFEFHPPLASSRPELQNSSIDFGEGRKTAPNRTMGEANFPAADLRGDGIIARRW
jgi:hypothetical protein